MTSNIIVVSELKSTLKNSSGVVYRTRTVFQNSVTNYPFSLFFMNNYFILKAASASLPLHRS